MRARIPGGPGRRRFLRNGGAVVVLTVCIAAILGSAQAATSTKYYTAAFSPVLAAPGVSHTYTLNLTNCGAATPGCDGFVSSQTLGSANVTVPSGFTVGAIEQQSGWTVTLDGSTLKIRSVKKGSAPGSTLSIPIDVTPVSYCFTTYTWSTFVKQSNNFSGAGNDVIRVGPDPKLTPATVYYSRQPANTDVAPAVIDSPEGVQVAVRDTCDNPVTASSGSVSVAIQQAPSVGATLGGTLTQPFGGGTATFANLTIDTSGSGFTLLASPSGGDVANLAAVESEPFNITTVCSPGLPCHVDNGGTSGDQTSVNLSVPTGGPTTRVSLGPRDRTTACSAKTSLGSLATIVPDTPSNPTATITVTYVYGPSLATTPGIASYIVCHSKPVPPAPLDLQPLPNCTGQQGPPCVVSKSHPGGGPLTIVVKILANDPFGGGFG